MLIVENISPRILGLATDRKSTVTIVDTDDGVKEKVKFTELAKYDLDIVGLQYIGDRTSVNIYPRTSYLSYSCGDMYFLFSQTDVWGFKGSDYYMHIYIKNDMLMEEGSITGYRGDCIGIPSRFSPEMDFLVYVYYRFSKECTVAFKEQSMLYDKGIRDRIKRKLLFN